MCGMWTAYWAFIKYALHPNYAMSFAFWIKFCEYVLAMVTINHLMCESLKWYCKRFYFRAINFSRFAAQKHIRGLLNSRWADAHLSFLYCTKLTFNEWYTLQVYLTGQHKNKAGLRQTWVYYPFASTHMVNTQLQYVSRMCIQNIVNIFAGFWIRACWISAKFAKINVPRIFPLLQ